MHYSQLAADRIAAAQQVISLHLPSLSGEACSACGHVFPCAFRRAADGTLDAYGRLPQRLPGATLRAAGIWLGAPRHRPGDGAGWPVGDVAWAWADANNAEAWPRNLQHQTSPANRANRANHANRANPGNQDGRDNQGRRRGWFDAVVNPAVGVAQVPNAAPSDERDQAERDREAARRPRFVPIQRRPKS
ncbi:hypothetical protein ACFQZ5_48090 [Dactylosporangium darangshiense]|uniref:Uncharacterized protein n=1 Tax=Dactylosporangium darangshiense TaxID=579108 RepID=A0ABP8CWB2_9ACTN